MTSTPSRLLLLVVLLVLVRPVCAQSSQTVTITEPGIIKLEKLFQISDTVALVRVISGDTECYDKAVYKGEVVKSFKGPAIGQKLYFGPYVGTRLGREYVLFLRSAPKPLSPISKSGVNYGDVQYSEIFNEGYSSMECSYECVFDGKGISQQCDDGVRVCTDYIKLPKSLSVFPPTTEDTPFGCRWVRKSAFLAALDTLHLTGQIKP